MKAALFFASIVAGTAMIGAAAFAQTTTTTSATGTATSTASAAATATPTTPANTGLPVVQHSDGTCTIGAAGTLVPCESGTGPTTVVPPGASVTQTPSAPAAGTPSTAPPGTSGTQMPSFPNTGAGGAAAQNIGLILGSGAVFAACGYLLARRRFIA